MSQTHLTPPPLQSVVWVSGAVSAHASPRNESESFLETELVRPPCPYIRILGAHTVPGDSCVDFDFWIAEGPGQLESAHVCLPGALTWGELAIAAGGAGIQQSDTLTALRDAVRQASSVIFHKHHNTRNEAAVRTFIQRQAAAVRYGGSVTVTYPVARQTVVVPLDGSAGSALTDGDTILSDDPLLGKIPDDKTAEIKTMWTFESQLQDTGPPPLAEGERRRLPASISLVRAEDSNRSWAARLQEAMVDGHHGEIKRDDPLPVRPAPIRRVARERGLETTVESHMDEAEVKWTKSRIGVWGANE